MRPSMPSTRRRRYSLTLALAVGLPTNLLWCETFCHQSSFHESLDDIMRHGSLLNGATMNVTRESAHPKQCRLVKWPQYTWGRKIVNPWVLPRCFHNSGIAYFSSRWKNNNWPLVPPHGRFFLRHKACYDSWLKKFKAHSVPKNTGHGVRANVKWLER